MKYFTLVEKKKSVTRGLEKKVFLFYFSFFFAKYFGLLNLCSDLFAWPITPTIILNISKPKKHSLILIVLHLPSSEQTKRSEGLISLIIDWFALVFISKFGVIPFISMSITFYCKYMSIFNLNVNVIFLMHLFSKIVYYVPN